MPRFNMLETNFLIREYKLKCQAFKDGQLGACNRNLRPFIVSYKCQNPQINTIHA